MWKLYTFHEVATPMFTFLSSDADYSSILCFYYQLSNQILKIRSEIWSYAT